jgi:hypothetical protein
MPNRFANGVRAIAMCDRCGQQYKLKKLKTEIIKQRKYQLLVCEECWDPDQPQLMLGTFPVEDPQALRNPRRDNTYYTAGQNNDGVPTGGSRDIQWGWNPVGGASYFDTGMTPNYLIAATFVGDATAGLDIALGPALTGVSATGAVGKALGPLAITGVQAIGETGNVFEIDMPITGVSATGQIPSGGGVFPFYYFPFPIQINTTLAVSAPAFGFNHVQQSYYGGNERLTIYSTDPWATNLFAAATNTGETTPYTIGETWIYADATNVGTPTSPVPEICFGRVTGTLSVVGGFFINLDAVMTPAPFPPYGSWTTYSGFRLETRFNIPCPNNGSMYFPDAPYGGYNPTYVNNGTTCTLSWSGNAAATLYNTYQNSLSIVGSKAYANWNGGGNTTMGLVTAVTYTGGVFQITMNTITPVTGTYPISPISFVPVNPNLSYVSGVSETSAVGSAGAAISMAVSTPSQNVQFQSANPGGYEFDVNSGTALANWIITYVTQNYSYSYMFADIGGTYVGLGFLPGSWQLTPGPYPTYYYKGYVGAPLPSNFPGLGFYSFDNFVVAAQFYINSVVANSYATHTEVGGVGTFTWTGGNALQLRDTYGVYPSLPVGTEISAVVNYKDYFIILTSRVTLGTLLSMSYSSGTFTLTYTVVTPFTPAHNPIQVGDNWFQSDITFLPLVINV